MTIIAINSINQDEIRVARIQKNKIIDLDVENKLTIRNKGNVYTGIITGIEPSLDAVFVEYNDNKKKSVKVRQGFLPFKEVNPIYYDNNAQETSIPHPHPIQADDDDTDNLAAIHQMNHDSNLESDSSKNDDNKKTNQSEAKHHRPKASIQNFLQVGQKIMIQVKKDERHTKGASLTSYVKLAGTYLVLMPNSPKSLGISRNCSDNERALINEIYEKLKIPENIGIIIRTAGIHASVEELQLELDLLLKQWDELNTQYVESSSPQLIHRASDIIIRSLRDYLREDISQVYIDDYQSYNHAINYSKMIGSPFHEKILFYNESMPLFHHLKIEDQIEQIFNRIVKLQSGASISIDQTEALIAIDINSGRSNKGSDISETAVTTNIQAAKEIARQARLRDMSGLIVIDFIDMPNKQHRDKVEQAVIDAFKHDKSRVQVLHISRLGLLTLSRQRLHTSLNEYCFEPCESCHGQGKLRTIESLSNMIIRNVSYYASCNPDVRKLQVYVNHYALTFLLNERRSLLEHVEIKYNICIYLIPNLNYKRQEYKIEKINTEDENTETSYKKIVNQIHPIQTPKRTNNNSSSSVLTDLPGTSSQKAGLISRMWQSVVKKQPATTRAKPRSTSRNNQNRNRRGRNTENQNRNNRSISSGSTGRYTQRSNQGQRSTQQRANNHKDSQIKEGNVN
jgi:ribonuclease E